MTSERVARQHARITLMTECSNSYCPSACSHLCWECYSCNCSGGFGASREKLEHLIEEHELFHAMDNTAPLTLFRELHEPECMYHGSPTARGGTGCICTQLTECKERVLNEWMMDAKSADAWMTVQQVNWAMESSDKKARRQGYGEAVTDIQGMLEGNDTLDDDTRRTLLDALSVLKVLKEEDAR